MDSKISENPTPRQSPGCCNVGAAAAAAGPLVSVLMPARNAAATIGQSLRSLQQQTFRDFELVLVDDGSDDGTAEAARRAWGPDGRLRLLRPGAVGLVAALQAGLATCAAPLVARMDADDVALPGRLAKQVDYLRQRPQVAIVGAQVRTVSDNGVGAGYALYDAWHNGLLTHEAMAREIFVESPLAHPSVLFRRQPIAQLGGYRDTGWPEDYDLWLRAHAAGLRFGKVQEVLMLWRDHPQRTSRCDPRYHQHAFLRCKAHFLARGPLRQRREVVLWGAGPIGKRLGRYLCEEAVRVVAFVDIDPRKIGVARQGAPTLSAKELPTLRDYPLVAAVGSRGARAIIRPQAAGMGWKEGSDFWCAA